MAQISEVRTRLVARRRIAALAAAGAVMLANVPMLAASADVGSAGPISVNVSGSLSLTLSGVPRNLSFAGTLHGSIATSGAVTFPRSQNTSAFSTSQSISGQAGTFAVTPTVNSDWSGSLDPVTGATALSGRLALLLAGSVSGSSFPSCRIGPTMIAMAATSAAARYSAATGKATISQGGFETPAIRTVPAQPTGCKSNAAKINAALGLPNRNNAISLTLTFSPAVTPPRATDAARGASGMPDDRNSTTTSSSSSSTTTSSTIDQSQSARAQLSTTELSAGDRFSVSGDGWFPNSLVRLTLDAQTSPVELGTGGVTQDGRFGVELLLPTDTSTGRHVVSIAGVDALQRDARPDVDIDVQSLDAARRAAARRGASASIGGESALASMVFLLGVIFLGAAFALAVRRRRLL